MGPITTDTTDLLCAGEYDHGSYPAVLQDLGQFLRAYDLDLQRFVGQKVWWILGSGMVWYWSSLIASQGLDAGVSVFQLSHE